MEIEEELEKLRQQYADMVPDRGWGTLDIEQTANWAQIVAGLAQSEAALRDVEASKGIERWTRALTWATGFLALVAALEIAVIYVTATG